ncbi:MAG TPA: LysR family transcriptional regulator, partial [Achromobacter sp.]|nr:LysR family transcriptional regulator [Achromobacter sp.]
MRLRHIEIFEAIRRTGSLTEAAAALHISQPAASKLLAHAEAQLGFKLFDRVKGRLVATREAEILTPEVARLNQDLNSVRRLVANLRDRPHGRLAGGGGPPPPGGGGAA